MIIIIQESNLDVKDFSFCKIIKTSKENQTNAIVMRNYIQWKAMLHDHWHFQIYRKFQFTLDK